MNGECNIGPFSNIFISEIDLANIGISVFSIGYLVT